MEYNALVHNDKDNVAICIYKICNGQDIKAICINTENIYKLTSMGELPRFHKISLKNISAGEIIIEYGEIIGTATKDIKTGEHVHVHNIKSRRL